MVVLFNLYIMTTEKKELIQLAESFEQYTKTSLELLKLESVNRFSLIGSGFLCSIILGVTVFSVIFFLSIAAAVYCSALLGNNYGGFLVVAACYLIVSAVLYSLRIKWMLNPLRDLIIRKMYGETK